MPEPRTRTRCSALRCARAVSSSSRCAAAFPRFAELTPLCQGRPCKVVEMSTSKACSLCPSGARAHRLADWQARPRQGPSGRYRHLHRQEARGAVPLHPQHERARRGPQGVRGWPPARPQRICLTAPQLVDISDDGFASLMNDVGEMRSDLKVPEGTLGEQIRTRLAAFALPSRRGAPSRRAATMPT